MDLILNNLKDNYVKTLDELKINKKKFKKLIDYLNEKYYIGETIISDELYDDLKENYEKIYGEIKEIGHKITDNKIIKNVELKYYTGSLEKVKTSKELTNWITKYSGKYVVSYKLDGLSALFMKENNKLKLYSRGDGKIGNDISFCIDKININKNIEEGDAIRGELIISKINFKKIANEFKNMRNSLWGIITNSENDKYLKYIDFIEHSVINPNMDAIKQMEYLKNSVEYIIKDTLNEDELSIMLENGRKNYKYEIDGLVLTDGSKYYPIIKDKKPKHSIAFKQIHMGQIAETVVLDVTWNISKHKKLSPSIIIKPVDIGGVTCKYVTAKNAKFIRDNVIGIGSKLLIIRSGDVIPNIYKILSNADNGNPKMPTIDYVWNETGVDILVKKLDKTNNNEFIKNQLLDMFGKDKLNVKFLGEGILMKLIENGYDDFFKIIYATKEELTNIEGFGETLYDKIYANIHNSIQNAPLYLLMSSSQCFDRGIGTKKLKLITDLHPNILELYDNNKNDTYNLIINIKGYSDKTTSIVIEGLEKFKDWFVKINKFKKDFNLEKIQVKNEIKLVKIKNNIFNDKKICFSGFRNKNLEDNLTNLGATIVSSVSSKTNILIVKDKNENSSKINKANELNITVYDINEINNFFK